MPPSSRVESRKADDADFCRFYSRVPPKLWLGLVAEDPDWTKPADRYLAMGGVIWMRNGAPLGFFDMRRPLPALALHRGVLRFLDVLKQVGEPRLYANCDEAFPRAQKWLAMLGFKPVPDRDDGLLVKDF